MYSLPRDINPNSVAAYIWTLSNEAEGGENSTLTYIKRAVLKKNIDDLRRSIVTLDTHSGWG